MKRQNLCKILNNIILIIALSFVLSACSTADIPERSQSTKTEFSASVSAEKTETQKFSAKKADKESSQTNLPSAAGSADNSAQIIEHTEAAQNEDEIQITQSGDTQDNTDIEQAVLDYGKTNSADSAPQNTCSFVINCENAVKYNGLSDELRSILPSDGIIFTSFSLEFAPGETAFDILARVTRQNGIPMEFTQSPGLGSKYIEGINSLREFDCGSNSGWTYKINNKFPAYGCDSYKVQPGDSVGFYYTVDRGNDLK